MCRTELMQKVQAMQRVMQEEPLYTVKPRGGHKVRETASTLVRDPNLDATVLVLQELENEHEFLCAPSLSVPNQAPVVSLAAMQHVTHEGHSRRSSFHACNRVAATRHVHAIFTCSSAPVHLPYAINFTALVLVMAGSELPCRLSG